MKQIMIRVMDNTAAIAKSKAPLDTHAHRRSMLPPSKSSSDSEEKSYDKKNRAGRSRHKTENKKEQWCRS